MRRVAVTTLSTVTGLVVLLWLKPHQAPRFTLPATAAPAPSAASPTPGASGGTAAPGATGATTGDGTFTGDVINTRYGPVQVEVTLANGRLTAVRVLQAPSDNGRDQQIASYSVPRLNAEALAAQSARIDAVSGASYTSQGYIGSLQSALDRAHP